MRSSASRLNTIHNLHFYLELHALDAGGHRGGRLRGLGAPGIWLAARRGRDAVA